MNESMTERLITRHFEIKTATPAQRAACRILDGYPLGELANDPDVVNLVGGPDALEALPTTSPTEVVFLAAVRAAKTMIACAAAIRMTQTVDLDSAPQLVAGEVARVSLVSLDLDKAKVAFGIMRETLQKDSALRRLIVGEPTADSFMVRHPSGRPVEVTCVAASKAGGGLVARWAAGVVFDEAPRMAGKGDGVINLDDARAAILGRVRPGAQILYIGSPWAPQGAVYNLVQEHWRRPNANLVVLRGTGPMLNPLWWTPERCAKLEAQSSAAYQTEVLGEFADPESGLLDLRSLKTNTREQPLELPYESGATYAAAVDPSEGSATGNAWTLVIVQVLGTGRDADARFRVALAKDYRGTPSEIWREVASDCRRYRIERCTSDQYAASANRDLAEQRGLQLWIRRVTQGSKLDDFKNLATLLHQDRVELPPHRQLLDDLRNIKLCITQTGETIHLPLTQDGRHCDFAPALAQALRATRGAARNQSANLAVGTASIRGETSSRVNQDQSDVSRSGLDGWRDRLRQQLTERD